MIRSTSSPRAVSMITGTRLVCRMRRSASMPSTRGIMTSSTTISKPACTASRAAASPSCTAVTAKPSRARYSASIAESSTSSSARRTVVTAPMIRAAYRLLPFFTQLYGGFTELEGPAADTASAGYLQEKSRMKPYIRNLVLAGGVAAALGATGALAQERAGGRPRNACSARQAARRRAALAARAGPQPGAARPGIQDLP